MIPIATDSLQYIGGFYVDWRAHHRSSKSSLPFSGTAGRTYGRKPSDSEYLASGKHAQLPSPPIVLRQVEERPVYVEKIVEKPIYIEKPSIPVQPKVITKVKEVPVERIVEIEKPVLKKVVHVRYRNDPLQLILAGALGLVLGLILGLLL